MVASCADMNQDRDRLADRRKQYATAVRARFGDHDPRVEAAFAKVPREAFLGPPPWFVGDGGPDNWHAISDPAGLYQDVLVSMNLAKGINNGQPSLHAMCLSALRLTAGDHVVHVGAGAGYYTAILAELAGSVDGYEIEPDLAARAAVNLAPWPDVTLRRKSAVGRKLPAANAIYVSAGAALPDQHWLDALRGGGRLLFPLTGHQRWGGMLLVTRRPNGFSARILCNCRFIDCEGLRDPVTARRLTAVFKAGGADQIRSLTLTPPPGPDVWFAGDGWYLSTAPAT